MLFCCSLLRAQFDRAKETCHDALRSARLVQSCQRGDSRLGIGGQPPRVFDLLAVQDILAQRLRQRLPARRQAPDRRPPRGRKRPPRRPACASGTVRSPTPISRKLASISSQKWSNSACDKPAPPLDRLQPPQHHPQMQHQQIKTAVNRIRHAQVPIKQRFSRLRHDHAIDGLNGAARGVSGVS